MLEAVVEVLTMVSSVSVATLTRVAAQPLVTISQRAWSVQLPVSMTPAVYGSSAVVVVVICG